MVIKQILLLLLACWAILAEAAGHKPLSEKGEFIARSFILTQQSLLKAPYRYAGILRDVLDRVEAKQPPEQSDEQNCDARYRIKPSGKIWQPPYIVQFYSKSCKIKKFIFKFGTYLF